MTGRDWTPHGVDIITLSLPGAEPLRAVALADYQAAVEERDNFRRALALLNAARVTRSHDIEEPSRSQIERILSSVGMTWADGLAVASIAAQFRTAPPANVTGEAR